METHDNGPQTVTNGGSEANEAGAVTVSKDDLDVPDEELDEALPAANVTENAITFRTIQEIQVTDEEMKRELLEELKEYIRGGTLRM
jgi:microcompartment protein CcmL/EutN